ncbi:hypothetical protein AA13595_3029 [Gluconacetobacter johannae DSM 13595]|uniref:Uncharacterized protein n=1 Tax=Gluconacetobacter johannae TaxID=112140 RepID=A0A7W4J9G8_9PROT|nr:hypothetical protein [Gluconacetobacter johannae]MBB2177144.1 hypothetical protein [Gluconacetobacter johannae]GBQ90997.1 hypothetical protein AA13595_3029 [Gluconacetobacter johannae DSM 13595]
MNTRTSLLAMALAAAILPAAPALAQQQAAPPGVDQATFERDMQEAARYPLPADFLPRMTATIQAIQAAGIAPPNTPNLSLAQTIDRTAAIPGLTPILAAHGFTPRDFVMGITAFGLTEALIQQPPPAGAHAPQPNPANVALIRNYPQDAQTLAQAMAGGNQQ